MPRSDSSGSGSKLAVVCIVPARNEADRIAETVRYLYEIPGLASVVVVDDGSTDGTADRARAAGADIESLGRRKGKGGAVESAVRRFDHADVYLLVDADIGATAGGAKTLLDAVWAGDADLAIGRLPRPAVGGFGLVKRMAAGLIRTACGFDAAEPLSGQRAVRGDILRACRPFARGFGLETGMTIDAVRLGARVVEVDVQMRHRSTGRDLSGFVHRGRQGMAIAWAGLVRVARLR